MPATRTSRAVKSEPILPTEKYSARFAPLNRRAWGLGSRPRSMTRLLLGGWGTPQCEVRYIDTLPTHCHTIFNLHTHQRAIGEGKLNGSKNCSSHQEIAESIVDAVQYPEGTLSSPSAESLAEIESIMPQVAPNSLSPEDLTSPNLKIKLESGKSNEERDADSSSPGTKT